MTPILSQVRQEHLFALIISQWEKRTTPGIGKPETNYPYIFLTLSNNQHQKSTKKRMTVETTSTKGAQYEP